MVYGEKTWVTADGWWVYERIPGWLPRGGGYEEEHLGGVWWVVGMGKKTGVVDKWIGYNAWRPCGVDEQVYMSSQSRGGRRWLVWKKWAGLRW